jgi:hypothetical protein
MVFSMMAGNRRQGVAVSEVGGGDQMVGELVIESRLRSLYYDLWLDAGKSEAMGEDGGFWSTLSCGSEVCLEDLAGSSIEGGNLRLAALGYRGEASRGDPQPKDGGRDRGPKGRGKGQCIVEQPAGGEMSHRGSGCEARVDGGAQEILGIGNGSQSMDGIAAQALCRIALDCALFTSGDLQAAGKNSGPLVLPNDVGADPVTVRRLQRETKGLVESGRGEVRAELLIPKLTSSDAVGDTHQTVRIVDAQDGMDSGLLEAGNVGPEVLRFRGHQRQAIPDLFPDISGVSRCGLG